MKKTLSFMLVVIFLTMTVSAMADIDMSVFEPNDFAMQLDETTGSIIIQKMDGEYPSTNTDNGQATVIPQVRIYGEGYAAFRLLILFLDVTPEGGYTKDVAFNATDASYTFTAVSTDDTHVKSVGVSGTRMDITAISFGKESYPLIKAIFDNPAMDVQVQYIRTDTTEIFKLDDYIKKAIALLYSGFVNAGGLSQSATAADKVEAEATTAVIVNTHEVAANKNADSAVVSANEDQIALWNEFVQNRENNDLPAVVLYTQKQQPVKSLNEISDKKQFAICSYYADYSDLVLQLFGYKTDDLIGISIRGGAQGTLDDPELRIYLGYKEWKEELSAYGWIPVRLIGE